MIEFDTYRLELEGAKDQLKLLEAALHILPLQDEISELEVHAQEPDFWENVEKAQSIQTRMRQLQKKVEHFHSLENEREELLILCELGNEEDDTEILEEVQKGVIRFRHELENMRLETLLTGEYDRNNAILTLHAGAGGTEAQDWVEMLYRMYNRWAESHDFEIKELDFLDGDEAGIKSASILLSGDNA